MSMVGVSAFAYDAKIDGIYYNFSGLEASVTYSSWKYERDYNSDQYYQVFLGNYEGNVVIPESITYNGTTYSVTSIGSFAFSNSSSLTSVIIPNSVTSIGNSAFYGCSNLTSVTIPNSMTNIGEYAFSGCSSLTNVTIPNSVTSIGNSAFSGFSGLTSVTIPNSVTSIGSCAFQDCKGLTNVIIGDSVTSIGNSAFSGCNAIKSISVPNSVTTIGTQAFYDCYSLESVTIGTGVLSIGNSIFSHRPKVIWLTNTPPSGYTNAAGKVNYIANDQYTSLGNKTVYKFLSSMFDVDGVKYVPVSPSERTCDAIDCLYDERAENIHIGETVTNKGITLKVNQVQPYTCYNNQQVKDVKINCSGDVGEYAFSNCKELNAVEARNGGEIGRYAFSECTSLNTINAENKGAIGNYAFYYCTKLTEAQIANTGTIGDYAFQSCPTLQTATLGEQVTGIGKYAFSGCSNLQSIVIPDAVTTMGRAAFENCSSMESVKMGTGVETIETYTFTGCSALTDMQIGSNVKSINTYAFNNCSSLPIIEIPQSVTKIDNYVFSGCKTLKNVYIADRTTELASGCNGIGRYSSDEGKPLFSDCPLDSVYIGGDISYNMSKQYGYSPFYRNTSLRSVHITDQETEISDNEFYGCTGLKNVRIGDGVTTIGNWAFSGCSSLDYFQFGASVETIGQEAFSDCVAVTKIISRAPTPPICGSQALDDLNKWECKLEVPEGMAGEYSEADQWKEFFFVEEGDAAVTWHKLIYEVDGETFKTVNVAAGAAITPEQAPAKAGYTFAGWTNLPSTMPVHDVTVTARYVLADNNDMRTRGDLNNDGFVNMADVTKLIDYILGRTQ